VVLLLALSLGCKAKKANTPQAEPTGDPSMHEKVEAQPEKVAPPNTLADPFRVGLFFQLGDSISAEAPLPEAALEALTGFMLAFDSLGKMGLNYAASVAYGDESLIPDFELDKDLFFVWKQNQYVVKMAGEQWSTNTSLPQHMRALANHWKTQSGPIWVLHQGSELEQTIAAAFTSQPGISAMVLESDRQDTAFWRNKLKAGKTDRIFICSPNERYVVQMLKTLVTLAPHYQLEVAGLPNWEGFSALSATQLDACQTILTQSEYINRQHPLSDFVQRQYLADFFGEASLAVYKAFDHAWHWGLLLAGQLPTQKDYAYTAVDFDFESTSTPDFYQNEAVRLLQFDEFQFNLLP
jgi:hypothetical protein